jgi:DNA-binding CsgD family transcriptional regulator
MENGRIILWLPWEKNQALELTPREVSVLNGIAQGLNSAEIAEQLGIKTSTVRTHVENARGKLKVRTRAELVAKAIISGRINPCLE